MDHARHQRGLPEPELVARAFVEAWADRDARAIADLFVEDADFVNVVGLWWRDRDRIEQAHAYGFEHIFAQSRMSLRQVRTRRLGEDVAVVHAAWRITGQSSPDGKDVPGDRAGVLVFVMARRADGWWAVTAQNTDRVAGADTLVTGPAGPTGPAGAPRVRGASYRRDR
jgi:uncharacterized protein (TIGR02246 family)